MPSRLMLLLFLCCSAFPAAAVVRRCVAADGTLVFTDRRCADVGAVERAQTDTAPAIATQPGYRSACPRTLRDLVDELQVAIDTRDVNRLAAMYRWAGLSNASAYRVMDRLQAIVDRPLVDIGPVYASGGDAQYPTDANPRRAPVALRLEQTLANGSTPRRTVLGLQRALGCWWVAL
jgi:hypothetical protein